MRSNSSPEAAAAELSGARERFAEDWHAVRKSLRLETSTEPRWSRNLIWPVLALAAGVVAGAGIWWRRANRE